MKKSPLLTRAVMRMARKEQSNPGSRRRMSMVLWDMFTGSSPYREVFARCLHPAFWGTLLLNVVASTVVRRRSLRATVFGRRRTRWTVVHSARTTVRATSSFAREKSATDMYVILSGQAEVMRSSDGTDVRLAVLGKGDIVGEMAIFQRESRSATVRALTDMRVMTVDRKIFLKRVHEDPSFVFAILQKMSQRIRDLNAELAQMKSGQ